MSYPRISTFKTAEQFQQRLAELGIELGFDSALIQGDQAPLARGLKHGDRTIGNRFSILPMEGWDGTTSGAPTELTLRRWRNFGLSGAKLIWGGEAVAIRQDGRANPNQLLCSEENVSGLEALRHELISAHREQFGTIEDLYVGLQLTHSGRFARPNEKSRIEPRIAYRHPILDARFCVESDAAIFSDDELAQLAEDFVTAAVRAQRTGYEFVDIKHCHGYLGHEILSGYDRPGKYGGSFENRTRFLRDVITGIQAEAPGLEIATRISAFDFTPYEPGEGNIGIPSAASPYAYAFGGDGSGQGIDLTEPHRLMELLNQLGVKLVCISCGSPYYNPHIQRPALFPPSDGYLPPEDPLVGVARQIRVTGQIKAAHPQAVIVGSGYTYLQEWLPHVGQFAIENGLVDFVGLGRMVLSYPELPADVLAGTAMKRKKVCRTFSDCTTAPRNGIVSGCYPLDPFYKSLPERQQLIELKKELPL